MRSLRHKRQSITHNIYWLEKSESLLSSTVLQRSARRGSNSSSSRAHVVNVREWARSTCVLYIVSLIYLFSASTFVFPYFFFLISTIFQRDRTRDCLCNVALALALLPLWLRYYFVCFSISFSLSHTASVCLSFFSSFPTLVVWWRLSVCFYLYLSLCISVQS